ncbi:MAG: NAD(P)H-hydrate dehydratase [Xanthomonadales bacterium]|nr:NAD(P)H-hydrate dehydratase [Xanthomonadales bacterium]
MLPERLYTAQQSRDLDAAAIQGHGVPGYTLMCRAGEACMAAIDEYWPSLTSISVYCGSGNNGGDGYVIARLAAGQGMEVETLALSNPERLRGDAARAYQEFREQGLSATPWSPDTEPRGSLLVDAMLGTGLDRAVEGSYAGAVAQINALPVPRLAVDIPSGLSADRGTVLGCAVRADATVTFIGLKQGLFTGSALDHLGRLRFSGLGVPQAIYSEIESSGVLLDSRTLNRFLTPRRQDVHKGRFGSVLVVGGDHGMPGAVRLAGEAALRSGSGLVRVATRSEHAVMLPMTCPELMAAAVEDAGAVGRQLGWASVVALGPGLGQTPWSREVFGAAVNCERPLVLDADGLNLLAGGGVQRSNWVLTPHPGEAAGLLGLSTSDIQADRFSAAREISRRFNAVCVLKGAGTVVTAPDGRMAVCALGNPGMATAGMGDVLTGVIAAMLAQGLELFDAACTGVTAHALAGDLAAADGQRGLAAGDAIGRLREAVNP